MIIQAFYNGVTQAVRSTIDTAAGGTLISKTKDETYSLIEEMTLSNCQWSSERTQPTRVGGKFEVDALTLLSAEADAMTQRLDRLNVNAVNSNAPSPCDTCGSIDHITLHCLVRSLFFQESNTFNYVQNFNSRPTHDSYSNTYNSAWKNHPNLSYRSNPNSVNMPPMTARVPPGFQRPPFPSQMPEKSNLELMMESMLMVQQK